MNRKTEREKSSLWNLILFLLLAILLSGCASIQEARLERAKRACQVTDPVWLTPPKDGAIPQAPVPAYYYANEDESIIAGAWWWDNEDYPLKAGEDGVKVGWFRQAGAELTITGQRVDDDAPPMHSDVPCCYPTRFQATGLSFPTEGCWEVTATAADSELTFTVWVEPAP
ncbi:MAG: hypothetical protein PVI99_06975 [Anaerolineales bacterium]